MPNRESYKTDKLAFKVALQNQRRFMANTPEYLKIAEWEKFWSDLLLSGESTAGTAFVDTVATIVSTTYPLEAIVWATGSYLSIDTMTSNWFTQVFGPVRTELAFTYYNLEGTEMNEKFQQKYQKITRKDTSRYRRGAGADEPVELLQEYFKTMQAGIWADLESIKQTGESAYVAMYALARVLRDNPKARAALITAFYAAAMAILSLIIRGGKKKSDEREPGYFGLDFFDDDDDDDDGGGDDMSKIFRYIKKKFTATGSIRTVSEMRFDLGVEGEEQGLANPVVFLPLTPTLTTTVIVRNVSELMRLMNRVTIILAPDAHNETSHAAINRFVELNPQLFGFYFIEGIEHTGMNLRRIVERGSNEQYLWEMFKRYYNNSRWSHVSEYIWLVRPDDTIRVDFSKPMEEEDMYVAPNRSITPSGPPPNRDYDFERVLDRQREERNIMRSRGLGSVVPAHVPEAAPSAPPAPLPAPPSAPLPAPPSEPLVLLGEIDALLDQLAGRVASNQPVRESPAPLPEAKRARIAPETPSVGIAPANDEEEEKEDDDDEEEEEMEPEPVAPPSGASILAAIDEAANAAMARAVGVAANVAATHSRMRKRRK